MSLEDPFFVVKDEVTKALNRTRVLYHHWEQLHREGIVFSKDDLQKTTAELRNSIRSIEWDLEDLEDTIGKLQLFTTQTDHLFVPKDMSAIVEKNPTRFRLNSAEVVRRRFFVQQTRDEIGNFKEKLQIMRGQDFDHSARKPLLENASPVRKAPRNTSTGYVRIPIEGDREDDDDNEMKSGMQQQASLVTQQDEQLVLISGSVGTLKSMSRRIGHELDEQALILDDMGHEMENTETKIDSTLKKMAKVLRMSNDRRQWMVIGVLTGLMVIVIILFYVL